jgi:hypothetical protein
MKIKDFMDRVSVHEGWITLNAAFRKTFEPIFSYILRGVIEDDENP